MILEIVIGTGAVVVFGALVTVGWAIGTYNGFQIMRQNIKTQFSNVLTEYQRRADMFVNLAESVKSYKVFESDTLIKVTAARGGNFGNTKSEQMATMKGIDSLLGRLMVVVEKYPKLKASRLYKQLMDEVSNTEDRINVGRTEYNDTIRDYNILVKTFPSSIIADRFKFDVEPFFEAEKHAMTAPRLKL